MKSKNLDSEVFFLRQGFFYLLVLSVLTLNACTKTHVQGSDEDIDSIPVQAGLSEQLLYDLLVGEFAGNAGDMELSVESYNRAAMETPDARVAARASYIAVYGERYEDALVLLERWEQLDPDDSEIARMYAITYLKLGQPLEAATYIQGILDTVEGNGHEKALAVKRLLAKESSTEDGLVVLDALNKADPGNQHMLLLQARYAAQLEKYDDALELLDQVLEICLLYTSDAADE